MTNSDVPRFAQMLALLAETFNEPMSDAKVEGYFQALQEFSIEQLEGAGRHCFRYAKYFPRPSHFFEFLCGDKEQLAHVAQGALLSEVRRVGYSGKPKLSDTTWEAVKLVWGSWRNLCEQLPASGPGFEVQMKQFRDLWCVKDLELERRAELLAQDQRKELP